jgi:hypothetical protein
MIGRYGWVEVDTDQISSAWVGTDQYGSNTTSAPANKCQPCRLVDNLTDLPI